MKNLATCFRRGVPSVATKYARCFGTGALPHIPPTDLKQPVTVSVTGAGGQIGYALIFRLAGGDFLGMDQPINLKLIEIPQSRGLLDGVKMELEDCAFPLLKTITATSDYAEGFDNTEYAFLVGARPRGPGMERADLLKVNGPIFVGQGKALNEYANHNCKVLVVGNPANTNALIASRNAPNLDPRNFSAMTRLDHNRAISQVAAKANCHVSQVEKMAIWGNHSPTMYPDLQHVRVKGQPIRDHISGTEWMHKVFTPMIQQRGAAVIEKRKASSAASAANGAIDHMSDWVNGSDGSWVSMGIMSTGEEFGGGVVDPGLIFSVPVVCKGNGLVERPVVELTEEMAPYIERTVDELKKERDAIAPFIE
eukprot:Platyproteum_vivax@DN1803_c0_g1_i1.p1